MDLQNEKCVMAFFLYIFKWICYNIFCLIKHIQEAAWNKFH